MQTADMKHMIVTDKQLLGPYSTAEALTLLKNDSELFHSVKWLCPQGQAPLLILEWFSDFAQTGDFEAIVSADVPRESIHPYERDDDSPEQSDHPKRRAERPPLLELNALQPKISKSEPGLRAWFALLVLALLGAALLWMGLKVMQPTQGALLQPEVWRSAKALGATPDALRHYQQLLEAKIVRENADYARSLLVMYKERSLYPEGFLPTGEWIAATSLVALNRDELDKKGEWRELLESLPAEVRQKGIGVVAYELSRTLSLRKALQGITPGKAISAAQKKKLTEVFEETGIILERVLRVVPESRPAERIMHGFLLSRLLALNLLTVADFPQLAAQDKNILEAIEKVETIFPYLSLADKAIIGEIATITKQKLDNSGVRTDWSKSLARLMESDRTLKFLCQLNETGSGSDALVYLLTRALEEKQTPPDISAIYDSCFVGLRLIPRMSSQSFTSEMASVIEFGGVASPDAEWMRRLKLKVPTFQAALSRLRGLSNPTGDWIIALYLNGIIEGRISGAGKKSVQNLCQGQAVLKMLCAQVRWKELASRWRDRVQMIPELRDEIRPEEIRLLSQNFILGAAAEALRRSRRNVAAEVNAALGSVRDFVDTEDPQLQFLFDYVQSVGSET